MKKILEEKPLATEVIQESKRNTKRVFIAFIISNTMWFLLVMFLIGLFVWYVNQSTIEEVIEYTQEAEGSDNSSINQNIGE